jgi:cellulase/cellobiase CelA1
VNPTRSCQITYKVNQWNSGFTADVTIKNLGPSPYSSWNLTWSFTGDQKVTSAWNANVTQSGKNVTATNVSWNGAVPVDGTASFGFQGSFSGTNATPANFMVNNGFCAVA